MQPRIRGRALALATLCLALAPRVAGAGPLPPCPVFPNATVECFDDEPSGSAASAGDFGTMSVVDGLILSESDAAFLLGVDTTGWANSGDQGVLNALQPAIDFLFDAPIILFRLSVMVLPGPLGEPVPVVLQGFQGDTLVATDVSNVMRADPDGFYDDLLGIFDDVVGFDRIRVFSTLGPCSGPDCEIGTTTSFFADTVKYISGEPQGVPEPGAAALALAALAGLGAWRTGASREGSRR